MGYELAVYLDKPTSRIQIILSALAADNNWKLCADGVLLSKFKVKVRNCIACLLYSKSCDITLKTSCLIATSTVSQ